jgi:hypothetical protein
MITVINWADIAKELEIYIQEERDLNMETEGSCVILKSFTCCRNISK